MTYLQYIQELVEKTPAMEPITTKKITSDFERFFGMNHRKASVIVPPTMKRLLDRNLVPKLRRHRKGIYYRTQETSFGEETMDEMTIAKQKYISDGKGYFTGIHLANRFGLTTQMSNEMKIASNLAWKREFVDKATGISIVKPKTTVSQENWRYLQILDAVDLFGHFPEDRGDASCRMYDLIETNCFNWGILFQTASLYYKKTTVIRLSEIFRKGKTENETP